MQKVFGIQKYPFFPLRYSLGLPFLCFFSSFFYHKLPKDLYSSSPKYRITHRVQIAKEKSKMNKNEKIIEFECTYGTAKFAGYVYEEELDDDEPLWFYDKNMNSQCNLGNAYFEGNEDDRIKLHQAFTEDFMFTQFLHDFKDESITIDRENYVIHINGGTKLEMNITEVDEEKDGVRLNAKISFQFGDTTLDYDWLEELAEDIDLTWSNEGNYQVCTGENTIIREIDYDWFDEEYDSEQKEDVEKSMLADAESAFVKQLIKDKGVYSLYQDALEAFFMKHDDRRIFDKAYISGAANNYEQMLESYTIEQLNDLCEAKLKEEIKWDIQEDYLE